MAAPATVTTTTDAGLCGASVSFQATATGTTPTLSYTVGGAPIASPYDFPVGTTTVTATATNSCGTNSETFTVKVSDVTPPTAVAQNVTVTLVGGMARVAPAQVDNGSSDACGIASLALDRMAFTCADIGNNTVVLTVTDVHGNVSTASAVVTVGGTIPAPSVAVVPATNVYTGGVPSNLYIGYGPQSATLVATGGMSYVWSPAVGLSNPMIGSPVFTATTPGIFTYTVTATNLYGCIATTSVTITVINAYCDKNKVIVCHGGKELCIAASAVPAHLLNHAGDKLGACTSPALRAGIAAGNGATELAVYPNPATELAVVSFRAPLDGPARMEVYNEMGQRVATIYDGNVLGGQLYSISLKTQGLTTGLYACRLILNGKTEMMRLTVAH
ncbi:T9SS type A sorting domain-containing protein [Hymenobacter antarcticus]|uniref:T9SS type A sorting domain-containing protein n=1 Tax=Hymenobacter antarcticus TaxID=486270 RepID=UPI0031F011B5